MDTYLLLSAVFFVMLILFQGLQSVGKKMNKIANTYGVPKEKPQPIIKSEPKVETAKEESKKPEDDNSFAQRCKRQIEYEKTLAPGSEELKKVREDFEKAYLEERESVRVKMCEGYDASIKNIKESPEYCAGIEQFHKKSNLYISMGSDFVNYTRCRP
jgi:hypothetical protein